MPPVPEMFNEFIVYHSKMIFTPFNDFVPFQIFSTKSDMLIHSQQVHKQEPMAYRYPQCQNCFANLSFLSWQSGIHTF